MLGMRPALKCGLYPSETLLEKTKFFLVSNSQLETALWLGNGVHLPFSALRPVQALCVLSPPVWVHMWASLIVYVGHLFLSTFYPQWILQSFFFLFCKFSWSLTETVHLVLDVPRSIIVFIFSSYVICMFVLIYYNLMLPWWWLNKTLMLGRTEIIRSHYIST